MHVFLTLAISLVLCANALAETVRTSQDGIDVQVTLSPTNITVGDPVELRIQAITDAETVLSLENDSSIGSFIVVKSHDLLDIPSEEGRQWTWSMQLDTFDAETTSLSGIVLHWSNDVGRTGSIAINAIPVTVQSVAGDALQDMNLRDIKPSVPLFAKSWTITIFVAVGSLVLLVWLVTRLLRKNKLALSPYDQAMLDLNQLKKESLEVHPFYTTLSDIIRHYLEGQFHISATGQTTREFLNAAKQNPHLEHSDRESLGSFLVAADLVKFARHEPGSNVNDDAIHLAEEFIQETREIAA